MAWVPRVIVTLGLIVLAHSLVTSRSNSISTWSLTLWKSCYSAQEHSSQASRTISTATSASPQITTPTQGIPLPVDILLEAITATLVICFGLALSAPSLRPIRWRVWAGRLEREGVKGLTGGSDDGGKTGLVGNPFRMLETRPGFVDIRRQRADFSQWVKGGEPVLS